MSDITDGLQDWIDKYGYSLRPEDVVEWLRSVGMVRRVDRELPEFEHGSVCSFNSVLDDWGANGYARCKQAVLRARFAAYEELE